MTIASVMLRIPTTIPPQASHRPSDRAAGSSASRDSFARAIWVRATTPKVMPRIVSTQSVPKWVRLKTLSSSDASASGCCRANHAA